jgi:hypothetical protein
MSKEELTPGSPGEQSAQPGLNWDSKVPDDAEKEGAAAAALEALKLRVIDADPKTLSTAEKAARTQARKERTAKEKAGKPAPAPRKPRSKPATKAADSPAPTPPAADNSADIPVITPAAIAFLGNPEATPADALALDPASQEFVQYHYGHIKMSEAAAEHAHTWLSANARPVSPAYAQFTDALLAHQRAKQATTPDQAPPAPASAPAVQQVEQAGPSPDDIKHLRTVVHDANIFLSAPVDDVTAEQAADLAADHIFAIGAIKGERTRMLALNAAAELAHAQPRYDKEFARQAPDLLAEAKAQNKAMAAPDTAKSNTTGIKWTNLPAAAVAPQRYPAAPADPEPENSIEPGIAPVQTLAALAVPAAPPPPPAPTAPTPASTLFARFMSKVAGAAQSAADRALNKGQGSVPISPAPVDLSKPTLPAAPLDAKSRVVPAALAARFVQVDSAFYFKDDKSKTAPAFVDRGVKLATRGSQPEVVAALVAIAVERGWSSITVKGSTIFRQAAWLEAARTGLQVTGYEPTEQDKATLAKQEPANVVAAAATRERSAPPPASAAPPATKATEVPAAATVPAPAAPAPAQQEPPPKQAPAPRRPLDPVNVRKAQEFLNAKPAFMLKKYPDDDQLTAAYAVVRWAELVAQEAQPGSKAHQDGAVAIVKRLAAESIAHGQVPWCPEIKVKQQAKQPEVAVGKPRKEPVLER